ncbi:MAG: hypothetical protein GY750_08125 [Lentisphaerae bacterium]|nr:hypothetical protein [Lentisphaerota bacterium]MCP4101375.1 hypothetical protein [Lentisphaerota bacterium]
MSYLQNLRSKLDNYIAEYDDNTLVWDQTISNEVEHCYLVHDSIMLASRYTIISSCRNKSPVDKDNGTISCTIFAMLRALAQRQTDNKFNLFLLSSKPSSEINSAKANEETSQHNWVEIVETYNDQVHTGKYDKNLFPNAHTIENIKCGLFIMTAGCINNTPQYNNYCINDNSFSAATSSSLFNTSPKYFHGAGVALISPKLTRFMMRHCMFNQLDSVPQVAKVYSNEKMLVSEIISANIIIGKLKSIRPKCNKKLSHFPNTKECLLFDPEYKDFHHEQAMWINNLDNTPAPLKPVHCALEEMFEQAAAGDTIFLRNGKWGKTIEKYIFNAVIKGCNVKILKSVRNEKAETVRMSKKICSLYKDADELQGSFEIRFLFSSKVAGSTSQATNFQFSDYGNVYGLISKRNAKSIIMTGTHNLGDQSFFNNHENMIIVESSNINDLYQNLFEDFWSMAEAFNTEKIQTTVNTPLNTVHIASKSIHDSISFKLPSVLSQDCIKLTKIKVAIDCSNKKELLTLINKISPTGIYSIAFRKNRKLKALAVIRQQIENDLKNPLGSPNAYHYLKKIAQIALVLKGLDNKARIANKTIALLNSKNFPGLKRLINEKLCLFDSIKYKNLLELASIGKIPKRLDHKQEKQAQKIKQSTNI